MLFIIHPLSIRVSELVSPILLAVVWALAISAATVGHTANFSLGANIEFGDRKRVVEYSGDVEAGDAEKLAAFIQKNVPKDVNENWFDLTLVLESGGGDFSEGMKIAHFLRENGIATLVRANKICASACAFAFMGGAEQNEGGVDVDRSVEVGAKLQFHAPYVDPRKITVDQSDLVRAITDATIEFNRSAAEFEIAADILPTLLKNDKDHSLFTVDTIEHIARLKINVIDLYEPKSLTLEMASLLCTQSHADSETGRGLDFEMDFVLKQSRELQQTKSIIMGPKDDFSRSVALPVAAMTEEDTRAVYCVISYGDQSGFECSSFVDDIETGKPNFKSEGESCRSQGASPPEMLVVPASTQLDQYETVAKTLQAKQKSIFDIAVAIRPKTVPKAKDELVPDSIAQSKKKTQKSGPKQAYVCNGNAAFANMRRGPNSSDYEVVEKLPNGTIVQVLEKAENEKSGQPWFRVSVRGKQGFIDAELLISKACKVKKPTLPDKAITFKNGVVCNADAEFANLRKAPNSNEPLVAKLTNGQKVTIIGKTVNPSTGHPWLQLKTKEFSGFMDSEKVFATCKVVQRPKNNSLGKLWICNPNAEFVNLRSKPNPADSKVIQKIANNTYATILDFAENPQSGQLWAKVFASGRTGFVDSEFISNSSCQ
jgi:uncharacterized protein YgiM (DUF1202 family)